MSLGLENSGFTPAFVNELNPDAMGTYLMNREQKYPYLCQPQFHNENVKDLSASGRLQKLIDDFRSFHGFDCRMGELDLLVGGPPCQGYSGIGHRRTHTVSRSQIPSNYLYRDMVGVIRGLTPKIFLFENVRGLLHGRWSPTGRKGEIWEDVLGTFEGLEEYHVKHELVFAKKYGVPQNRPRVFIVGVRKDVITALPNESLATKSGLLPMPKEGISPPHPVDLLGDLVDMRYKNGGATVLYPRSPKNDIQREMRKDPVDESVWEYGHPITEHEYSRHSERIIKKFEYMIRHGGDIPPEMRTKKFSQRVIPRRWGKDGPTITATSLPDDLIHFEQPRILTVREWARIQTFPDWYRFCGKRTTGGTRRAGIPGEGFHDRDLPKYTQIGNAVPVKLAFEIGTHFMDLLTNGIESGCGERKSS
jgi:DNA (cytosine-5)-methyltransferase 1